MTMELCFRKKVHSCKKYKPITWSAHHVLPLPVHSQEIDRNRDTGKLSKNVYLSNTPIPACEPRIQKNYINKPGLTKYLDNYQCFLYDRGTFDEGPAPQPESHVTCIPSELHVHRDESNENDFASTVEAMNNLEETTVQVAKKHFVYYMYDQGPINEGIVPEPENSDIIPSGTYQNGESIEDHVSPVEVINQSTDIPSETHQGGENETNHVSTVVPMNHLEETALQFAWKLSLSHDRGPSSKGTISKPEICIVPDVPFKTHQNDKREKCHISAVVAKHHSEEIVTLFTRKLYLHHDRGPLHEESISEPENHVIAESFSKRHQDDEGVKEHGSTEEAMNNSDKFEAAIPFTWKHLNQRASEKDHVLTVAGNHSEDVTIQFTRKIYLPHDRGPSNVAFVPQPEGCIRSDIPSDTQEDNEFQSEKSHASKAEAMVYSKETPVQVAGLVCEAKITSNIEAVCSSTTSKAADFDNASKHLLPEHHPYFRHTYSAVRQLTYNCIYLSFIQLLFLSTVTPSCASGSGFVEVPASQEVSNGTEAVFRCRHLTAFIILWRVNDTVVSLRRNPLPYVTPGTIHDDSDNLVDTLTIIARPEYTGTVFVCVARFDDGTPDMETDRAVLLVLVNSSTVDSERFLLSPESLNITVDTVAMFQCRHATADSINWRINGSIVMDPPEGVRYFSHDRNLTLVIIALHEYNQTIIECVAFYANSPSEASNPAILMIQGKLGSVTKIHKSISSLTWTPPFSLDLTGVDPDIVYCVEVYNITCGRNLLINDCNVTESSYTSDASGYIYEYIVTPRNNIPGARNGTSSQPVEDQLPTFNTNSSSLSIDSEDAISGSYNTTFTYDKDNVPIPSTYALSLNSFDDLEDMDSVNTSATKHDLRMITLDVHGLPLRRLWNCTVLAYKCQQHPILTGVELSTHDIQSISVSSPLPGQVRVTGHFIQGSTATGVLIITVSDEDGAQYHMHQRNDNKNEVEDTTSRLAGGEYKVSVFVIEKSGLPFNRTATMPRDVLVIGGVESEQQSLPISYVLHHTSTGVCITCVFPDSSTTDCVAVVHQRISHLSSSGLMNIEASHKLNRSGDTAYGCIVMNMQIYQVGVIGGKLASSKERDSIAVITGSVAATVLILLCTVVNVALFTVIYRKRQRRKHQRSHTVTHDTEQASERYFNNYEVIPLKHHTRERASLLRIQFDSQAENLDPHPESLLKDQNQPTVPHAAPNEKIGAPGALPESAYAEPAVVLSTSMSAPPAIEKVKYDTVSSFLNQQGQQYAMVAHSTSSRQEMPDDLHKTEYSQIIHSQQPQEHYATQEAEKHQYHPPPTPFTVENLLTFLNLIVSKWKLLGETLSLDDDHLDEIYTNNPTDNACLQEVLERYMKNGDFQHSWDEMSNILRRIGQDTIADKIYSLHVRLCKLSLPGKTEEIQSCCTQDPTGHPTNVKQIEKTVIHNEQIHSKEMQTKAMQTERGKNAATNDASEGKFKEESSGSHGTMDSLDDEKDTLSVNPIVSENEGDTDDHEEAVHHESTNTLKVNPQNASAQESQVQDGVSQVDDIHTERNQIHGTVTGMIGTSKIPTLEKEIGEAQEEDSGIVGDAVEEQIRPVKGEAAQAEIISIKKFSGAVEHDSASCCVKVFLEHNDETQSASMGSSASADEGYCGGHEGDNVIHSSQQRKRSTEAVQTESTDDPEDRVVVHNSSDQPTILSKDHTKSSKYKHINDTDMSEHISKVQGDTQNEGHMLISGACYRIPKDEKEKAAGRKVLSCFSPGIFVPTSNCKSFLKICDIDHHEDTQLDSQPVEDPLDYYNPFFPTLTLPDHLAATFKKIVSIRMRYGFTGISLEEPINVDVTRYGYNKSGSDEGLGVLLPFSQLHTFGMHLGIGSSSCGAIGEVELNGTSFQKSNDTIIPTATNTSPMQNDMQISVQDSCDSNSTDSVVVIYVKVHSSIFAMKLFKFKAKISHLLFPHKTDAPFFQNDLLSKILRSSFASIVRKLHNNIMNMQPEQLNQISKTQLISGKHKPREVHQCGDKNSVDPYVERLVNSVKSANEARGNNWSVLIKDDFVDIDIGKPYCYLPAIQCMYILCDGN